MAMGVEDIDGNERITVSYEQGGQPSVVKKRPKTLVERIAYVRAVDLGMTRLQLAKHAGLCERTVIRIEQSEGATLLLPSALAIAEALGVSLD